MRQLLRRSHVSVVCLIVLVLAAAECGGVGVKGKLNEQDDVPDGWFATEPTSPMFVEKGVLAICATDDDCAGGFVCASHTCMKVDGGLLDRVYTFSNKNYVLMLSLLASFLAGSTGYVIVRAIQACLGDSNRRSSVLTPIVFVLVVVVGPLVGAALSLSPAPVLLPSEHADASGPHCRVSADPICGNYRCNVAVGACYTECVKGGECVVGASCTNNTCTLPRIRAPIKAYFPAILAIVLFVVVVGGVVFFAPNTRALPYVVLCVAVGSALAGYGLSQRTMRVQWNLDSGQRRCATHADCYPYFCDVKEEKERDKQWCFQECHDGLGCQNGFECLLGDCVPKDREQAYRVYHHFSWPGVVALSLTLSLCVCMCISSPVSVYLTDEHANLYARCEHASVCGAAVALALVIGLGLSVNKGFKYEPTFFGTPNINNTDPEDPFGSARMKIINETDALIGCSAAHAAECIPYVCDNNGGSFLYCTRVCAYNADCAEGCICVDRSRDRGTRPERGGVCVDATYHKFGDTRYVLQPSAWEIGLKITHICLVYSLLCGFVALYTSLNKPHLTQKVMLACLTGCVVITITIAAVDTTIRPQTRLSNAGGLRVDRESECATVFDPRCAPYVCNMNKGKCVTECEGENGCSPDAACSVGSLDRNDNNRPPRHRRVGGTGICTPHPATANYTTLAHWLVGLVVVMSGLVVAGSACLFSPRVFAHFSNVVTYDGPTDMDLATYYWLRTDNLPLLTMTSFYALAIVFAISVSVAAPRTVPYSHKGSGLECDQYTHMSCAPYFCDMREGRCESECRRTSQCMDGYKCTSKNKCVAATPWVTTTLICTLSLLTTAGGVAWLEAQRSYVTQSRDRERELTERNEREMENRFRDVIVARNNGLSSGEGSPVGATPHDVTGNLSVRLTDVRALDELEQKQRKALKEKSVPVHVSLPRYEAIFGSDPAHWPAWMDGTPAARAAARELEEQKQNEEEWATRSFIESDEEEESGKGVKASPPRSPQRMRRMSSSVFPANESCEESGDDVAPRGRGLSSSLPISRENVGRVAQPRSPTSQPPGWSSGSDEYVQSFGRRRPPPRVRITHADAGSSSSDSLRKPSRASATSSLGVDRNEHSSSGEGVGADRNDNIAGPPVAVNAWKVATETNNTSEWSSSTSTTSFYFDDEKRRNSTPSGAFLTPDVSNVHSDSGSHPSPTRMFESLQPRVSVSAATVFSLGERELSDDSAHSSSSELSGGGGSICGLCRSEGASVSLVSHVCKHVLCDICARVQLHTVVESGSWPAVCPVCEATGVPASFVERLASRAVVSFEFAQRFVHMQVLRAFASYELVSCPFCDSVMCIDNGVAKQRSGTDKHGAVRAVRVGCRACRRDFCFNCGRMWTREHKGKICTPIKYASTSDSDSELEIKTTSDGVVAHVELGEVSELTRACPQCGVVTVHWRDHGSHHIAPGTGCHNCGHHFCFVCLQPHPCERSEHALWCTESCGCGPCPVCVPGRPCADCPGCAVCESA